MKSMFKILVANPVFFSSLFLIGFLFTSCGSSGSGNGSEAQVTEEKAANSIAAVPSIKKYGIKSGIVTFESTGFGIKTRTVLYFDDFGSIEAEEKYDLDNEVRESSFCDGTNRYTIIYEDKTAYNKGTCFRGIAYRFDWNEVSKADSKYNAKKLPNISVAGKDCESFTLESSGNTMTYAGWNNICLLLDQTSQYGDITHRAVSFEENPTIPAGKLSIPADFQIK
jgi:hypothetical protein